MRVPIVSFITCILLVFPFLAAANLLPRDDGSCGNGGTLQCCSSTQTSSATALAILSSLFGLVLPNLGGLIGLACSPVDVASVGASSCTSQPVCCTNTTTNGVVALGCNPVHINP